MAVFKCKLCGGTIELREKGMGICDSCGTKQTVPNTDDEKKMNLLDRANHFRMQNDFDKAMGIYEQILDEDTTDSDVYYSIALCRYGITYVDDSITKKKIPTMNRFQNTNFTEDADYLMAVKYALPEQSDFYRDEGAYIDKVQQGIMDITKNEKPYDVFICYKETDDNGNRTHDSVLANDLYHGLTSEGFKVFYSRITLEGKLGTAYEPYIFSALNSSKVMVVIGTKPEYFKSAWVKNEWSRFLLLIREGKKKTIIPAYKDMDPYDLPEEFANLQAQDMSKLGFMQDLIRGVKKILGGGDDVNSRIETSAKASKNYEINTYLKRVKIFLEDSDFENANIYCEKILDLDAENGEAFFYKFLVENRVNKLEDLITSDKDFTASKNYKNASKYGNEKIKNDLTNANQENTYIKARNCKEKGDLDLAFSLYDSLGDYKDALNLKQEIVDIIYEEAITLMEDESYAKAFFELKKIADIKDVGDKIKKCMYYIGCDLYEEKNYAQAKVYFKRILDYDDDVKPMFLKCCDIIGENNNELVETIRKSLGEETEVDSTEGDSTEGNNQDSFGIENVKNLVNEMYKKNIGEKINLDKVKDIFQKNFKK